MLFIYPHQITCLNANKKMLEVDLLNTLKKKITWVFNAEKNKKLSNLD